VDAVLLRPLRPNQKVARCTERASDPAPLAESARREIQAVDPDLPVFGVRTLHGMLDASLAQRRFSAQLMAVFATLAMLLVAVRVYGVLAYSIRRRRARLASGWRMVLWQGIAADPGWHGIRVAWALGLTRVLSRLLYGVSAIRWCLAAWHWRWRTTSRHGARPGSIP
jgi:putative ABC transport system permease protein